MDFMFEENCFDLLDNWDESIDDWRAIYDLGSMDEPVRFVYRESNAQDCEIAAAKYSEERYNNKKASSGLARSYYRKIAIGLILDWRVSKVTDKSFYMRQPKDSDPTKDKTAASLVYKPNESLTCFVNMGEWESKAWHLNDLTVPREELPESVQSYLLANEIPWVMTQSATDWVRDVALGGENPQEWAKENLHKWYCDNELRGYWNE